MSEIKIDFDENVLIRKEEMELRWGPGKIPPQDLIDYWHATLRKWLDEYAGKTENHESWIWKNAKKFENPVLDPETGEIIRLDITGGEESPAFVIPFSRKEKDGEAVWMVCPISPLSIPGTMWEFYGSTKGEESVVMQSWNIFPIKEEELKKVGRSASGDMAKDDFHVTEDTVKLIHHEFDLMVNYKYQDLPMNTVGPRVFRTIDPRYRYQSDERKKYEPLIAAQQVNKEELKAAIEEKIKECKAKAGQEQNPEKQ